MTRTPTPTPTPTPLPSLREQQQRLLIGQYALPSQLLVVPPLQRRHPATSAPAAQATGHVPRNSSRSRPSDMGPHTDGGVKRKRGRPRKNPKTPVENVQQASATKPAYMVQKEEQGRLSDEVRLLQERVELLRLQAGLPTQSDRQEIAQTRARNAQIDAKLHTSRRQLVQLQSQVTQELMLPVVNTLSSHIHLPCDMDERRAILRGIKDVKLRRAAEVGIARFRDLQANAAYLSEERFTTDDGVFHCNRWEMSEYPQFQSAKQMYEALLFWMYNLEISVTEMVNQVAVREDDCEDIEPTIWNHRIVTTTEDVGCTEELNSVGFAQFYDSYDLLDGAPLGIIVIDTVNEDDLYPYRPHERTRKDVQSFHLFCEHVDPVTRRKSVMFKTCLLNAQLPPQFPVESHVVGKLHEYMSRWVELMKQYLSEYTIPS